jgi:hypothetical protein
MGFNRIPRVACLGLLCGSILSGCAGTAFDSSQKPSLSEARKFDTYPLFYSGYEVSGLPLEDDEGGDWSSSRVGSWTFYYGDCDPHPRGGLFEGSSCSPPLQIQNWSICGRVPGKAHRKAHLLDFQGTKAVRRGNGEWEIFTGRTTVVIFAREENLAKAAARQLRNVRLGRRASRLPPPVPGSLSGKLPCQQRPRLDSNQRPSA